MDKEKIGFFGGCFNPPINTHIDIANKLVQNSVIDKVIFVPVGDYYKKQNLVPAIHRYNMLQLSCENYKNLEVEDIASTYKGMLYATDTFELIQKKYSNTADIYFIMGSDNFQKMPSWKNYEEIIKKYKFIVIERLKHEIPCNLSNVIYFHNKQVEDISSTSIRHKLQNREDVTDWVNEKVFLYIQKNKLYIR